MLVSQGQDLNSPMASLDLELFWGRCCQQMIGNLEGAHRQRDAPNTNNANVARGNIAAAEISCQLLRSSFASKGDKWLAAYSTTSGAGHHT